MTDAPEITYNANDSAREFHDSRARVKALMGPLGSGKSSAAILEFFFLCIEATTAVRGLVVRETYRQLRDATKPTFEHWFPSPVSRYVQSDEMMFVRLRGIDGIEREHSMAFRHCRTAAEATNLLSTEYGYIWLEEPVPAFDAKSKIIGAGLPYELFTTAISRQRQPGIHRRHLVLTFNPPSKFHWTHREFIRRPAAELERMGYALFRQPAYENQVNLPEDYYAELERILSPDLARRWIAGESVTIYPGKRVYDEVKEHIHITEGLKPDKRFPINTCHDFGRTPATLFYQNLPGGMLRFYKEIQLFGASTKKMVREMKRVMADDFAGFRWGRGFGDPAGLNPTETDDVTSFQIMADGEFPLEKGALTNRARQDAVKEQCRVMGEDGTPGLLVDRFGCPMFAEGLLGGYRYPVSTEGLVGTAPIKNEYSHVCNAGEYGISGEIDARSGKSRELEQNQPARTASGIPVHNPLSSPRRRRTGSWMTH